MYIDLVTINLCPGQGGGGVKPSGTLEISENGVYDVYSYSSASVDVHPSASLSETYISNGNYNITGEFNGGVITVDVPAPQFVTETLNVSANGTYTPGQGVDGYSQVVVDVPQSVTGFTEKDVTEGVKIVNLSNSASFVIPGAFLSNSYIQTVNLPNCLYLGSNKTWTSECLFFGYCRNLRVVSLPLCSIILNSAFISCNHLSSVYIPTCNYLGENCFKNCTALTSISLPVCEVLGRSCFESCSSLTSISLPVCKVIGSSCFQYCSSLTSIYLPVCSILYTSCFYNCINLTEVTLNSPSVCKIDTAQFNGTVFKKTPIESGTGSIYVPASLVDAYKSAQFWSRHSSIIFPIPE